MSFTGHVKQGVVVFDGATRPAEGALVRVEELPAGKPSTQTWGEFLKDFVGAVEGLPDDMAENHDHYIHGSTKR